MHKHLNGRAILLAGVSLIALGSTTPSFAQTVNWGATKTPDIIAPEPTRSTQKPEKFTPKVTRTVVTRTITTSTGTTTQVLEPPPAAETPVVVERPSVVEEPAAVEKPAVVEKPAAVEKAIVEQPRRETVGLSRKPVDETPLIAAEPKPAKRSSSKAAEKTDKEKTDKTPSIVPPGTLHIIVSIDQQRASLYSNGNLVASTKVSTGTKTHPTPMGVFSVIQKNRHHVSNLYGAPMPYMQRLTWSGTAMHTGALPGYPASHGCIRLPDEFAQMLWKATKLGARVIVTREEVKPVEIAHEKLFAPKPPTALPAPTVAKPAETTSAPVRTADATGSIAPDTEQPAAAPAIELPVDPSVRAVEAMPSAQEIERRGNPVSIFVSRKDGKLYVRQALQPLFDIPLTLRDADQPVGTHVYTAMEMKDGAMRWTSVSIPSAFAREVSSIDKTSKRGKARLETTGSAVAQLPPSSATAALDRLDLPQEAIDRLAPLLIPGSSLIVSDNGIGGETGRYTDFIVLTR